MAARALPLINPPGVPRPIVSARPLAGERAGGAALFSRRAAPGARGRCKWGEIQLVSVRPELWIWGVCAAVPWSSAATHVQPHGDVDGHGHGHMDMGMAIP
eukprot:264080-Prymnesium_polylepis.1